MSNFLSTATNDRFGLKYIISVLFIKKIKKRRDGTLNDGCVNIFKSNYPELYKNIYNVLKKEKMHNKSAKTYYINKLKVLSILEEYNFDYKQTTKTFNQKTQIANIDGFTAKLVVIAVPWRSDGARDGRVLPPLDRLLVSGLAARDDGCQPAV